MSIEPVLHVSIRCQFHCPSLIYQRLAQYFRCEYTSYPAVRVSIHRDNLDIQEEMISIQALMYDTVVIKNCSFKAKGYYELYLVFVTLIEISLEQLLSDEFHRFGDSLIIFVSPIENDDTLYNFEWLFKANLLT